MRPHIGTRRYFFKKAKHSRVYSLPLVLFFLFFSYSGCSDINGAGQQDQTEAFSFGGSLYVTNGDNGSLLAFDSLSPDKSLAQEKPVPRVVDGNLSPSRQFPDRVSGPAGIFLDQSSDTLYVANASQNSILIYDSASTLVAPFPASRVISGNNTHLNTPYDLSFDPNTQTLYVVNKDANTIVSFHSSCTAGASLNGNIAPCHLLVGDLTQLDIPRALAVDVARNILFISNMGNDSILVYDTASSVGAAPSACDDGSFLNCNVKPDRVISPHTGAEGASKLELPFGLYSDTENDRLYVVNAGQNRPAIFIYENASALDGAVVPERVITANNAALPSTCSPTPGSTPTLPLPRECNTPQLNLPAGIDVDVLNKRIFVVNNNSTNNVNETANSNTDSVSLLVFNDIDTTCTFTLHICSPTPNSRIGGDVSAESGTTLSSPLDVAFDPGRDITYVANTGGDSLFVYSLEGNTEPLRENAGTTTTFNLPSSLFYDNALDRLYVANFGANFSRIIVYDQVSIKPFNNTAPSWEIADSSIQKLRGIYIDKTRNRMLTLNSTTNTTWFGVLVYDLTGVFTGGTSPDFPLNNPIGPTAGTISPPFRESRSQSGLTAGGATAMAVDEGRGEVYVTDKGNNSVVVFDYLTPPPGGAGKELIKKRTITGLNKPSGIFIDTQRDILYVTNNGEEAGAATDHRANTVFVFNQASTKSDGQGGCATPCLPDKIISSIGLSAGDQNKLKGPISPYVDLATDRLFLINSAQDQNAVFTFKDASTLGDTSLNCISGVSACLSTLPSKVLIGDKTKLDFSNTGALFTGSVIISTFQNTETLYVAQSVHHGCTTGCSTGALLAFGLDLSGRVPPFKIWPGGGSAFSSPEALGLDVEKNILYVVNQSSNTLSIMGNADKIDVTLQTAGKLNLSNIQLNRPAGLFVDAANDRLYISNSESSACSAGPCDAILVFENASTLAEGSVPGSTISDPQLRNPQGITLDATRSRLYVASQGNHSILIFPVSGGAPTVLTGPQTTLDSPIDVAVDSTRDLLYVLNQERKEVLVFENASTLTGNEAPTRVISGSDNATPIWVTPGGDPDGNNFMVNPSALFLDANKDLLYIADRDAHAVHIFSNASVANGQAIHKTLAGDKTGLSQPSALTVDTSSP